MSLPDTTATALIGRTVHITRGQKYWGEYNIVGVAADNGNRGYQLRTRQRSPHPAITGEWLTEVTVPVHADDIHDTETDARAAIKARKSAATARREAAGPRMMPATDGNYLAMLVGATKVRAR